MTDQAAYERMLRRRRIQFLGEDRPIQSDLADLKDKSLQALIDDIQTRRRRQSEE
jgi:hypothetical protein